MICCSLWKAGTLEAFGNSSDVIKKNPHLFIYFILQRCDLHTKRVVHPKYIVKNVPLLVVSSHSGRYNHLHCRVEVESHNLSKYNHICGHLSITQLNNSSTSRSKTMSIHKLLSTLLGILITRFWNLFAFVWISSHPIKMMKKTHTHQRRDRWVLDPKRT